MRFNLLDLLIGIACGVFGAVSGVSLARLANSEHLFLFLSSLLALLVYLLVTPSLYRRFHLRPMLYPLCPHCKEKNRWYWFEKTAPDWPRDVVTCSNCKQSLELWYEATETVQVSTDLLSYQLVWPQSWGRWQAIVSKDS